MSFKRKYPRNQEDNGSSLPGYPSAKKPRQNSRNAGQLHEWWTKGKMPKSIIDYFLNLESILDQGGSDEDIGLLYENAMREVSDHKQPIATTTLLLHPQTSRVFEKLVQVLLPYHLRAFVHQLPTLFFIKKSMAEICRGRCSSHVLQTLLIRFPRILVEESHVDNGDTTAARVDEDAMNTTLSLHTAEHADAMETETTVPLAHQLLEMMIEPFLSSVPSQNGQANGNNDKKNSKASHRNMSEEEEESKSRSRPCRCCGHCGLTHVPPSSSATCCGSPVALYAFIQNKTKKAECFCIIFEDFQLFVYFISCILIYKYIILSRFGISHIPESVREFPKQVGLLLLSENVRGEKESKDMIFNSQTSASLKVLVECLFIKKELALLDDLGSLLLSLSEISPNKPTPMYLLKHITKIQCHICASHVLQTLFEVLCVFLKTQRCILILMYSLNYYYIYIYIYIVLLRQVGVIFG
ncbi:hypothetical protein RFI_16311 [Reticulomyxa filosa]|uniref:Uncharacterized protein n=1 Tax=Reticulomyxa filosa TaxID=46433 RepID=X6N3Q9_RETFI|nr:hypothetical protein RFI_16311 [Reticulomyxa filosa]|eukprot:ETO20900.1 hypothetical protein RFI_16311 [Reticulomyxa filosa]